MDEQRRDKRKPRPLIPVNIGAFVASLNVLGRSKPVKKKGGSADGNKTRRGITKKAHDPEKAKIRRKIAKKSRKINRKMQ